MSLLKVVLLVVGIGVVLFALVLAFALWPRVRDVSAYPALQPLLHRPLPTKRPTTLFQLGNGLYTVRNIALVEQDEYIGEKIAAVPVGTPLTLTGFKYSTNAVSGFTHLLALGEVTLPSGAVVAFEYNWGSIDPDKFTKEHTELPRGAALWQEARPR
ncbi:hypothetical protein [Hymenobacter ruricola]|uniref:DUF4178 domain-containing protein n=1 Tax=Hymenobacter ruricola TaxID=2791023 RepID=A0ABS0I2T7_9BACT|nr:hypothetical protein [Hymenobacter ruricola]MBF9221266.1 hypothetical protein [Hymenobacter ruricola]